MPGRVPSYGAPGLTEADFIAADIDCPWGPEHHAAALVSALQNFFARPGVQAASGNLGWLIVEKVVRLVLGVGVGFWMARFLGPAGYGELNFALAIVGIAMLLAELGLDGVVRRELIQKPDEAPKILAAACGLRLLGASSAWLVVILWSSQTPEAGQFALLSVLSLTLFQPVIWVIDLWFQARLQAKLTVAAQLTGLIVGAVVRVFLILREAPLVAFAWAAVIELMLAALVLAWLAKRAGLPLKARYFERHRALSLMREAWPLLLSGFAVILYLRVDAVMLRYLKGEAAVGLYSAAIRFTEIWYFVPLALATSLLPALLRARERGVQFYADRLQASYDLNAGIAYLVAVPLALTAPWVINLAYGPAYADAAGVLTWHIWSSVFVFLGVSRGQFLVNEGHTRFYLAATVAGLLINVGLNWILIPRYGPLGAAQATVVAQAAAAWLSSFFFAPIRQSAWMQTRALLIPFRWYHYVRTN